MSNMYIIRVKFKLYMVKLVTELGNLFLGAAINLNLIDK